MQRIAGFNDLYDYVFKLAASCDRAKFPFPHNGIWYTLWCWKGDYYNLGMGAEIGLYWALHEYAFHWQAVSSPDFLTVDMTLTLKEKNGTISTIYQGVPPSNWWVTTFIPELQGKKIENIGLEGIITMPRIGMYDDFDTRWKNRSNLLPPGGFNPASWSVTLDWPAGVKGN